LNRGESQLSCANDPERQVKRAIQIKHNKNQDSGASHLNTLKKNMNAMRKMKARFSRQTTRHPLRDSLLCGWLLAAVLPVPVLSQNYSTPYTFTTIAGTVGSKGKADGTNSGAQFSGLYALALDSAGSLYGGEFAACTVRKVTPVGTNWVVTTLAGKVGAAGSADGTNSDARFNGPGYLAVDSANNIYVGDFYNNTIRKVTPVGTNWVVTTLAGKAGVAGSADGTNSDARFNNPGGVAVDTNGNVYVADWNNNTIRKVAPVGTNWVVTTLTGAVFNYPADVAVDSTGNLYVADLGHNTIRKVTPGETSWVVTTLAGKAGSTGYLDGMGSAALFNAPNSVSVYSLGNLYVAETANETIRKVTPVGTNWVVTTLAGKAGIAGSADGTGSAALFNFNTNINNSGGGGYVVVDTAGNLYVPDFGNYTIRKGYPPLVMTSSGPGSGSNGGPFGFTLTGPSGQSVVVESSSDLVNWLPLWTNTLAFPAALTFRDPQGGVYPNRFYRAFTK
jgi:sugar lactone lactonase YvrE